MKRAWRMAAATGAVAVSAATLLRFPPEQYRFYPRCPVNSYLHLLCPGCGATRALAALLRGQLVQAVHFNALFVVLLPFLAGYALLCCWRARWVQVPNAALYGTIAATVVFTVARNV